MSPRPRAVVLLSGGMDSAVAAALAKAQGRDLHALSLRYGQRHQRELRAARRQASLLGCLSHQVLELPLDQVSVGSLLKAQGGALRSSKPGLPPTYVSFRNGAFLSFGLALAEALGAGELWGGWCASDRAGYPDCRADFFKAFEKAGRLGTRCGRQGRAVSIKAPLLKLSKSATVRLGARLGVDFKATWTCYLGAARPCRACDACRLRQQGFAEAGLADPL